MGPGIHDINQCNSCETRETCEKSGTGEAVRRLKLGRPEVEARSSEHFNIPFAFRAVLVVRCDVYDGKITAERSSHAAVSTRSSI